VPVTVGSTTHADRVAVAGDDGAGLRGELTTVRSTFYRLSSTVRALLLSQVGLGAAVLLVLGIAGYARRHRS